MSSSTSTSSTTVAPEVLWAQRSNATEAEKNQVFLTINAPNLPPIAQGTTFNLTSTGFEFKADVPAGQGVEEKHYAFSIDFFAPINVEESSVHLTSKLLFAVLRKQEAQEEFWPRLTKDKVRLHNVKTDFDKWVDEDEQDDVEEEDPRAGMPPGMDMSQLGGMGGGMGGMGGMGGLGGAGGDQGLGNVDIQQLLQQMGDGQGGAGGMPGLGGESGEFDGADDEEGPHDHEEDEQSLQASKDEPEAKVNQVD